MLLLFLFCFDGFWRFFWRFLNAVLMFCSFLSSVVDCLFCFETFYHLLLSVRERTILIILARETVKPLTGSSMQCKMFQSVSFSVAYWHQFSQICTNLLIFPWLQAFNELTCFKRLAAKAFRMATSQHQSMESKGSTNNMALGRSKNNIHEGKTTSRSTWFNMFR